MEQKEEKSELEKKREQREQLIAQRKKSFYKSLKKSEEEEKKPSRKKSDGKKEKLEKKKRDRKDTLDDIRDDLLSARYILIKDLMEFFSISISFFSLFEFLQLGLTWVNHLKEYGKWMAQLKRLPLNM